MKLLTIVVPCYQSQDYMRHCIDTLLGGGGDVEILIVDDGSTDDTAAIADALQAAHPGMIRAIHQTNEGHGGAVMTGLRHATGRYFKVVDSDDWLDEKALETVLSRLRSLALAAETVDMLLCNYVYDKVGRKHKRVVRYGNVFPRDQVCTWQETGHFRLGQYLLMHAVIFRTGLLLESGLNLPRHTFYVDNLFVYLPMRHVRSLLYLDVDLYHYFIGRADQSVNEQVMIRRIDQQIQVNRLMLRGVDLQRMQPGKLRAYLCRYMEIVTVVSTILLYREGTPESLRKKQALWEDIRRETPWFYAHLSKRTLMGFALKNNGLFWRKLTLSAYRISRSVIGFS